MSLANITGKADRDAGLNTKVYKHSYHTPEDFIHLPQTRFPLQHLPVPLFGWNTIDIMIISKTFLINPFNFKLSAGPKT